MKNLVVTSIEEWLNLPEIVCPILKNQKEQGEIYFVYKVGLYFVQTKELSKAPKSTLKIADKIALPTAVIENASRKILYKLPVGLSEWVEHSIGMAHAGLNVFPCKVEFGELEGHIYAKVL